MPTGYTAVLNERDVTFKEFAMRCARAFGALVLMRDDPMDADIPDEFKPSPFYAESVKRDEDEIARVRAMTDDELEEASGAEYQKAVREQRDSLAKDQVTRSRYESMLTQARAWTPPTPDHQGLKDFMVQQIEESIRFDCGYQPAAPVALTGKEWQSKRLADLERSLSYSRKSEREERERAASRTEWVRALKGALS